LEYFAQTLVPIITACAMIILVLLTGVYAWLTYRLVGETARQNRPYVFLKLGPWTKYS
jgi:hypothetical protein